jgi:hypothetical protein
VYFQNLLAFRKSPTQPLTENLYCTRGSEVEVEEGELVGKKLSLHTHALARTSFAKEPHVKEVWLQCELSLTSHLFTQVTLACV